MNTNPTAPNRRILLIDDNESIHQDFRKILNPSTPGNAQFASAAADVFGGEMTEPEARDFEIDSAFQGQEALEKVRQACAEGRPYAMAFVDVRMPPGWDGIETISRIWSEYPHLQVVICTAYSDYSLDQVTAKLGRTDRMLILKKPFDPIEALQLADALTEKWRLSREALAKLDDLEQRVAERTLELQARQQQLIEARKMELVGKLAGGVAHDFNTILTAITGHADLIRQLTPADGLPCASAVEIGKSASRAAQFTHQLLAFSRKQMLKPERIDANAVIRSLAPRFLRIAGEHIEVSLLENAANPWARADVAQIEEVLVSLAHNARDAMPNGGKLTVQTADVTLDPAAAADAELHPGDYLMIAITDNGAGIPDDVMPHLFEPYFTTKAPGDGKGLGLAMCHGILKQSGGHIAVRSDVGLGASFMLYLPRLADQRPNGPAPAPPSSGHGTEVILLVEENPALRGMAGALLESQGYTVCRAATYRQAMSIAGRMDRVDLLIADSSMQDMTGAELAEWLRSSRPRMKTLLTCGFEESGPLDMDPGAGFLRKPYTPSLLCTKAREALNGLYPTPNSDHSAAA